ncbi:uncharacterized protein LOC129706460 [Leucoraja erinacea]|uniref:uncharacterized protein LOC129706460 n=1 Tax=Leucoraja erinaceus TaxID=7782 RepID=UPI00245746F2|nr:uncharacterized protein LOC129706460 [Leucoraja erinacea]
MNNTEITLVAPCPPGWIGSFYSCYWIRKDCKKWKDASQFCKSATNGVHLVDINTEEEFQFISTHLRSQNDFSMLWTGLNDIEIENELQWTDKSAFNLSTTLLQTLPSNDSDCYALQLNAVGPDSVLTGLFCFLALPYICEHEGNLPCFNTRSSVLCLLNGQSKSNILHFIFCLGSLQPAGMNLDFSHFKLPWHSLISLSLSLSLPLLSRTQFSISPYKQLTMACFLYHHYFFCISFIFFYLSTSPSTSLVSLITNQSEKGSRPETSRIPSLQRCCLSHRHTPTFCIYLLISCLLALFKRTALCGLVAKQPKVNVKLKQLLCTFRRSNA